ncbi:MAG: 7-cyano-7-deazaguanine synthase in queuosine biosynthesis [Granulosicoccus sp.]|jgi:7-cyano-7-deazaguanine synthase in queuosine biosynthesis
MWTSAISWYKDSAVEFINQMNHLAEILTRYNVEIERIIDRKLHGKVIYEDEFQVTIVPFRDVSKPVN